MGRQFGRSTILEDRPIRSIGDGADELSCILGLGIRDRCFRLRFSRGIRIDIRYLALDVHLCIGAHVVFDRQRIGSCGRCRSSIGGKVGRAVDLPCRRPLQAGDLIGRDARNIDLRRDDQKGTRAPVRRVGAVLLVVDLRERDIRTQIQVDRLAIRQIDDRNLTS
nr:MAG TPA: hypothetical protein [Caudoviricetes sp.]